MLWLIHRLICIFPIKHVTTRGVWHHSRHWPKAVVAVGLLLVDIRRLPRRFDAVAVLPELDEEIGHFASRRQESLQVARVVAGMAEAPRRDDGRAELQAPLQTGSPAQGGQSVEAVRNPVVSHLPLIFQWKSYSGLDFVRLVYWRVGDDVGDHTYSTISWVACVHVGPSTAQPSSPDLWKNSAKSISRCCSTTGDLRVKRKCKENVTILFFCLSTKKWAHHERLQLLNSPADAAPAVCVQVGTCVDPTKVSRQVQTHSWAGEKWTLTHTEVFHWPGSSTVREHEKWGDVV